MMVAAAISNADVRATVEHLTAEYCNYYAVRLRQVGHQDFVWELRKDARVVDVFEALWGTSALLTSFDGCARCLQVTRGQCGPNYKHSCRLARSWAVRINTSIQHAA
jgi:hypothetical protein